MNFLALFNGRADHAERGSVSGSGERAGIAVGEHSAGAGHERSAVAAHRLVGGNIFGVHALRFFDQILFDL